MSNALKDRPPVAAGRFYPGYTDNLENEISELLTESKKLVKYQPSEEDELLALVAPHAGYVFSGTVAASGFQLLKEIKPRKRVFLIGSSHHTDFNGVSIYNMGNYITPLGQVKVDIETANQLIEKSDIINFVQAAHAHEHALEVLLPFIQYFWKDEFQIIPIIIASHSKSTSQQLSEILQPYFNSENLFVISTDLSHYPNYEDAVIVDKLTVNAIQTGIPEKLIEQIQINKEKYIPNLATSICGWTSALTLMHLVSKSKNTSIIPLLYQNSGDAKMYGESDKVVGYQSMAITQKANSVQFTLSEHEKEILIETARKSIISFGENGAVYKPKIEDIPENLLTPAGAFVSVYLNNELRGCIGRLQSTSLPLIQVISDVAASAAFNDNRFAQLTDDELTRITIEISVLTPLKKISSLDEITLGKHGIFIKKDFHSGTFLPQVADKTNWTVEEFVSNCSKNKAGIGWDGWKDADLFTYEAIIFKG